MKSNLSYGLGITLLFLSLIYSPPLYAWDETSETDIRSLALGGVRSISDRLLNPATISFRESGEVGVSVINRFGMKELNTSGVYGIFPNSWLDAGCRFSAFGYEDYQLLQGKISLAKKISSRISIGVQFGYLHESSILEEKDKGFFIADPGIYWQVHPKFELAFLTENLLTTSEFIKPSFYIGMKYKPTRDFQLMLENGYDLWRNYHLSLGIEYEILSSLWVRFGFRTDVPNPGLGACWGFGKWKIDVVFLMHNSLDLSSGIGLGYSL